MVILKLIQYLISKSFIYLFLEDKNIPAQIKKRLGNKVKFYNKNEFVNVIKTRIGSKKLMIPISRKLIVFFVRLLNKMNLFGSLISSVSYENVKIEYVKDRPGHDFRYAIDCSKIKRELKWRVATNINDGLSQTIKWYYQNQRFFKMTSSKIFNKRLGLKL